MIVYVLDDDEIELEFWRLALNALRPDWVVRTFTKVSPFKEEVMAVVPDLIVLDLVLNLENGIDACKWVKAKFPTVKLFINTSMEGGEYQVLAERCGAAYLCKTVDLYERVRGIIDGRS